MRYYILFLFFFICLKGYALDGKYQFKGVLILGDVKKQFVSYTLDISIRNNIINGYAITDAGGNHETKNKVSGNLDPKKKTIQITENEIIYTKSKEPKSKFCYVRLTGKYKQKKENIEISGEFKSDYLSKEPCLSGTFQLISSQKLESLLKKGDKTIQKDKSLPDSLKRKYDLASIADSLSTNYLRKDEVLKLFIKNDEVELILFDHDREDGDEIQVMVNEKVLLPSLLLESRRKIFKIKLEKENNIVTVKALNEGNSPPNTGTLIFKENESELILRSYLKAGEKAEILIVKTNQTEN